MAASFPGQYYDQETGLHYNYFRDYSPKTGRYLQVDPIGLSSGNINLYLYAIGNPINLVDMYGLDATVVLYPGAAAFGHVGIGVNSTQTTGYYSSPDASNWDILTGNPVEGVMKQDTRTPEQSITIKTTPEQDEKIKQFINDLDKNPGYYDLYNRNCATTVHDALKAGGINIDDTILPRKLMENLEKKYGDRK